MTTETKPQDTELEVEGETDEDDVAHSFDIASYPSDLTLSGIREMWVNGDIIIPDFQRRFVWTIQQASLLVDSFLQGLPVPQLFLYTDDSSKSVVIDGQQRILTVVFFFEGYFGFESQQEKRQVFRLKGLGEGSPYLNKSFKELDEAVQRKFRSRVLRAINIRQLHPESPDPESMYHIFERLNTGGTPLKAQEIRNCVFRGPIVKALRRLNDNEHWRKILGRPHPDRYQKDIELLLRVLALTGQVSSYEKPMKEFLNGVMEREINADSSLVMSFGERFPRAAELIVSRLGEKPFHVRRPLNSSVMDAVFCTILEHVDKMPADLDVRYKGLLSDEKFTTATSISTSDKKTVELRFQLAEKYLFGK